MVHLILGVVQGKLILSQSVFNSWLRFFLFCSNKKGFASSTMKIFRSAIVRTVALPEGSDFSFYLVWKKSLILDRLRQRRLVPSWDLSLDLKVLQFPPFEPLESVSVKHLTLKYNFLLALASGRRRSELHDLSVFKSCLLVAGDKSSVTLLTNEAFLANNQLPDKRVRGSLSFPPFLLHQSIPVFVQSAVFYSTWLS